MCVSCLLSLCDWCIDCCLFGLRVCCRLFVVCGLCVGVCYALVAVYRDLFVAYCRVLFVVCCLLRVVSCVLLFVQWFVAGCSMTIVCFFGVRCVSLVVFGVCCMLLLCCCLVCPS